MEGPSKEHDVRDGWYVIDPYLAGTLLSNQPRNRGLKESKATRFANEMKEGNWKSNGEPIILDEEGKLLDGQGRMRACQISGKAVEVYVIHGIPRSFFPSLDRGQLRTGADTLTIQNFKDATVAASIARLAILYEMGKSLTGNERVENFLIEKYAKKNRLEIESAISFCIPHTRQCPVAPSMVGFILYRTRRIDMEKANIFATGVLTGASLPSDSPALVLRNRMMSLKGETYKLGSGEKLAFIIKSWNAYITGKPMLILKWNKKAAGKRRAESFPRILNSAGEEQ